MRIRFATAWCTATLAGLTVSWWGVQHAVGGTALGDAPAAAVPARTGRPPAPTDAPASPAKRETLSPSPDRTSASPSATPTAGRSTAPPAASSGGRLRTFTLKSGRVVLEVHAHGARLVSASPERGFTVREWRREEWLRVDLTDGEHGSAVFATWNGHPTLVQVHEY
ncbi:hypothetical protein [Actinomadura algeriensis]|uniref:Secreted protein n=1 Tax=Actinomadura algeriensis TaxID=1679523 RepID=A0ABR9JSX0_9ACTN|nr:hypothetical protein [Actinomadura algeriensis]MBE1533666.1 hypothetical protein [Actinomadura algeriensis]